MGRLPENLRAFVLGAQTAAEARARQENFAQATAVTAGDKVYVTHDGLLCGLLRELSDDTLFTCTRSHYFEVVPCNDAEGMRIGRNNLGYRG